MHHYLVNLIPSYNIVTPVGTKRRAKNEIYKNFGTICLVLFSFVGSSDAIKIEVMESSMGYEIVGPSPYLNAYVETNNPFYTVDWFVDSVYQYSSFGDGNRKIASHYAFFPSATLRGNRYEVKAIAYTMDPDDLPISDTDSFRVKVYKSVQTSVTTDNGVDIWAAIDRHFYQNGEIIATHRGQTSFCPNGAGFNYRFKREVTRPDGRKIKVWPREGFIAPTSANTEHSEDFPVDLNGQGPGAYESWAYTRIEVEGEGTTATSTETFHHEDD